LLLAANRDELYSRPSRAPGRHWPDRPHVRAGLDVQAGGTWLGLNDAGVVAGLLNRHGTFRPDPTMRSRGDIVLKALGHPTARGAASAFAAMDPAGWRPFNLIVADAVDAFWLCHRGAGAMAVTSIPAGVHMIEAGDLDDPASPRVRHGLRRYRAARVPDPAAGGWQSWQAILGDRRSPTGRPEDALCLTAVPISGGGDAGTVSSSVVALSATAPAIFLHADGPPDRAPLLPVPRTGAVASGPGRNTVRAHTAAAGVVFRPKALHGGGPVPRGTIDPVASYVGQAA
jgi:hypothetical protein